MTSASPRASLAVREIIRRHLAAQGRSHAVSISKILNAVRTERPLQESDEELIYLIAEDAIDHGLAVHFDRTTGD